MRVFIHGSSVSRELLTLLNEHGFEISHYSPRQSLIPLLGAMPDLLRALNTANLMSRSERRAAIGSITADLSQQLDRRHADIDMVLWDITDERLGVYDIGKRFVTRTIELYRSGLDQTLQSVGRHIPFGTEEHLELWSDGARAWADHLRRKGLADRVVVAAAPWATRFTDGTPTPTVAGIDANLHATLAAPYYEIIARELPTAHFIGRNIPTSSSINHRRGPSPYNFSDDTNYRMATELFRIAFDPEETFPPPRPSIHMREDGTATISAQKTWGTQFALHVYKGRDRVVRSRYQPTPVFSVGLEPGSYRAKVYHKHESRTAVASSSTFRFPLSADS